jgi:hypothetical protein
MSILGVINTDPGAHSDIERAFRGNEIGYSEIRYLRDMEEITEFLNYGLPELVIINFSDPVLNIDELARIIKDDSLIFNFGVIGLFTHGRHYEEELIKKYKNLNVLVFLDNFRLATHLKKYTRIIEKNYQIIFQREFTRGLFEGAAGSFSMENDLGFTPVYASICATILAQRGLVSPEKKMQMQFSLSELIINAIEHGNCGITQNEKLDAQQRGVWAEELVAEKCKDPAVEAKRVMLSWEIQTDRSVFVIQDEGEGFDAAAFLVGKGSDKVNVNGKSIRLASRVAEKIVFNKKGNKVTFSILHDSDVSNDVPIGFSHEQVIHVKKGDEVLKENEASDYLYYISSGNYTVYVNGNAVGLLTPQDIFMGEMSFLTNQRRSASVRADTEGILVRLTRKSFVNIVREYPYYGIFLAKLLAKRLVRSNEAVSLSLTR